jgi:hypothetical protein
MEALRRLRLKLRLQRLVHSVVAGLWVALAAGLCLLIIGRWHPIKNLYLWSLLPLIAWLIVVILVTLFKPIQLVEVARRVDFRLGLKDRLSTAMWLNEPHDQIPAPFAVALVDRQQQDAAQSVMAENLGRVFAIRMDWRRLALAALIVFVGFILTAVPNPMDRLLAERQIVAEETERIADDLDALAEELAQESDLSNPEIEAALEELQDLTEALRENPGDLEDALADISDLEQDLEQRIGDRLDQRQAAMDALSQQLESLAQAEGLSQETASDPSAALEELTQSIPSDPQAMAQSLSNAATAAAQTGDTELAQALAQLASALQSGDEAAVQEAGEQAGESLSNSLDDLASQTAQQQLEAALQSARSQLTQRVAQAGAGQGESQGEGQGDGEGEGEGEGQGQSEGQGQGPGQGQGQPGGGGGTTADSLPGANSSGQAGEPEGEGQSAGTGELEGGDGQSSMGESTSGEMVYVPGQDTGQGEINIQEMGEEQPGSSSSALVPYQSVFPTYLQSTLSALEGSLIPPGLENYIRGYFTLLEP